MANKLPAMQFYPGDWMKDTALRSCSPEARGVWIDLLCLMFESPNRGVLRTKNCKKMNAISIKNLSQAIAGCKPKYIQELIENGVVRVARKDGALYSKRLIRDELHRRHKSQNGHKNTKANRKQTASKPEANTQAKKGSSSSSSSSTSVNTNTKGVFEIARKEFSGRKRGLETEFSYFQKTHKDWRDVLPLLLPAIQSEQRARSMAKANGTFFPTQKDFKSWIYNRYWEQEWGGTKKTVAVRRCACGSPALDGYDKCARCSVQGVQG